MYRKAHATIATGIASVLGFLFGLKIFLFLLTTLVASFLGVMPDYDLKLITKYKINIKHRGVTHTIPFLLIISFIITLGIFFIGGFVEIITNTTVLTGLDVKAYYILPYIELNEIPSNPIVFVFICCFCAAFSHLLLDMITKSGISFGETSVKGEFQSSGYGNGSFIFIGAIMTLIGWAGSIMYNFLGFDFYYLTIIVIVVTCFTLFFGIIGISVLVRNHKINSNVFCEITENGVEICAKKTCFTWNGKEYCNEWKNKKTDHF